MFLLYCSPVYDSNFIHLDIKNTKEISIGRGKNNQIIYNNALILETHARISMKDEKWTIENYDTRYPIFVNNLPINHEKRTLFNGDDIFIMGLKIIIMNNSIYINRANNNITFSDQCFTLSKDKNRRKEKIEEIGEIENYDDEELEIYKDKDYYSRAPRITNIIETEKIKIDAPPQVQDKQEVPLLLVLGSSLSKGAMMVISVITAIQGRENGTASTQDTVIAIVTALVMLISILVIPFLNVKYDKKQKVKYEEKRQKRYKEYLKTKRELISKVINKQRDILFENYVFGNECTDIILNKKAKLWERKIEDYDFAFIRLGTGNVPLDIDIQYPEEQFAMENDDLIEILNSIADNSKFIKMHQL